MPDQPVLFRASEARRIQRAVEHVETKMPYRRPQRLEERGIPRAMRYAQLSENLSTGSLTSPATADAEFLDADDSDPPQLSASGDSFTVINYSTDYSGSTGDFIIVARVQGGWHVLGADC